MHEVLFDDAWPKKCGLTTLDFAKAMIDEDYHPMTIYFPLIVHGAMLIEPTESESKASLDLFIATLRDLAMAAIRGEKDRFVSAPYFAPRRRFDETRAAGKPVLRWVKGQGSLGSSGRPTREVAGEGIARKRGGDAINRGDAMDVLNEETQFECPDGFLMPAFVYRPQQEGAFPGIVFIYEAFGLNNEMKRLAKEVSSAGYAVMIPDLFSRGMWIACIVSLMKDLSAERGRGIEDLLAARAWLGRQAFVDPQRMAVLGLCMGGGFALVLAKTGLFRVAAPFYGPVPRSIEGSCPLVASFGAKDKVMTPGALRLEAELERLAIPHDLKIYRDAGHGFMNRAPNPVLGLLNRVLPVHAAYDADAASDAMRRLQSFLAVHL